LAGLQLTRASLYRGATPFLLPDARFDEGNLCRNFSRRSTGGLQKRVAAPLGAGTPFDLPPHAAKASAEKETTTERITDDLQSCNSPNPNLPTHGLPRREDSL